MTQDSSRPSIPAAIVSLALIAGLAATGVLMAREAAALPGGTPVPGSTTGPGASAVAAASPPATAPWASVIPTAGTPSPAPVPTTPIATAGSPSPTATPTASSSAGSTPTPTRSPTPSPTPSPSPHPQPSRTPRPEARVTRLAIPSLDIDLAVVAPRKGEARPLCGVAEFLPAFRNPGQGGTTYLYANAMPGMLLPLMQAVHRSPREITGSSITVWTGDDFAWTYRITSIRRHQRVLDWAFRLPRRSLVVQTADADGGLLMVVARLSSRVPTTGSDAHPPAHPRACP